MKDESKTKQQLIEELDELRRQAADVKRAAEALDLSERLYRAVLENTGSATVVLEEDTTISLANAEFEKLTGYTRAEIEGKMKWPEFNDPEDLEWMLTQHRLRRADPAAARKSYDFRLIDKAGRKKDIHLTVDMVPGTSKSIASLLDVTDRKRAEAALKESEERYKTYIEKSFAGVYVVQDGLFKFLNDTAASFAGYKPEELVGRRSSGLVHPDDWDRVRKYAKDCLLHEDPSPYEFRIITKDGSIHWIMETVTSIQYEGKIAVLGNSMDITARKRAEEMSRQSEEIFSKIFMTAPDGIAITRMADGLIIDTNFGFTEISGWERDEVIGQTSLELAFWADPADRARLVDDLKAGNVVMQREIQFRRKGGELRTGIYSARSIDFTGEACILFIIQDITHRRHIEEENRKLERRLFQSQKMEAIGTLAGGIAHDFNNILSSIIGYSELCLDELNDRSKAYSFMEQILKASDRAKDLVQQILTFSRQSEQEKKPLLLAPIIKEVVKFMRASLPTTIEIRQTIDKTTDVIMADPTQMHQVLMNLCTNAGHAMRDTGGVLEVGLHHAFIDEKDLDDHPALRPGRYLELSVRDTGHGISRENQGRIFDPYFTTKEKGEGTGLGLAVVHGIVKDHGGEISVYSEEDHGTVFRIYLPLIEKAAAKEKRAEENAAPGRGEVILFVDDEIMMVDMNRKLLEKLGYVVVTATDPVRAIEAFNARPDAFDLVITDKTMPHMTGFDLTQAMREIRADIPVILCSGFQEKGDLERAKALGINQLITKPSNKHALAQAIRVILDRDRT